MIENIGFRFLGRENNYWGQMLNSEAIFRQVHRLTEQLIKLSIYFKIKTDNSNKDLTKYFLPTYHNNNKIYKCLCKGITCLVFNLFLWKLYIIKSRTYYKLHDSVEFKMTVTMTLYLSLF